MLHRAVFFLLFVNIMADDKSDLNSDLSINLPQTKLSVLLRHTFSLLIENAHVSQVSYGGKVLSLGSTIAKADAKAQPKVTLVSASSSTPYTLVLVGKQWVGTVSVRYRIEVFILA